MFANLDVGPLMRCLVGSNVWSNESNDTGIIFQNLSSVEIGYFLGANSSVLYA